MGRIQFSSTIDSFAENAALYAILQNPDNPYADCSFSNKVFNGLARAVNETFGRLYQSYPGEFVEKRQKELSRYPRQISKI